MNERTKNAVWLLRTRFPQYSVHANDTQVVVQNGANTMILYLDNIAEDTTTVLRRVALNMEPRPPLDNGAAI